MEFELKNMTAPELCQQAKLAPAILVPVASIEILGTHGPVGLDFSVAQTVAPLIAKTSGCLLAPIIPYGDTMEFDHMKGTVHIPTKVLEEYCYAVADSLHQTCGARAILFLNVHSINGYATSSACRRLHAKGITAAVIDWWAAVGNHSQDILDDWENGRGHGGEMITSVALAIDSKHVHMERAACEKPKPTFQKANRWRGTAFSVFGDFSQYCCSGAWGDTRTANKEKGSQLIQRGVEAITEFIRKQFGEVSLSE